MYISMIAIYDYNKTNCIKLIIDSLILNLKITKIDVLSKNWIRIMGTKIPSWTTVNHPKIKINECQFDTYSLKEEIIIGFYVKQIYIKDNKILIKM